MEQLISTDVLLEKYAKAGEKTKEDIFKRVAKGVAVAEKKDERNYWEEIFFNNMQAGAIGAGRIMSAAGTSITATSINCFVQPIADSILESDSEGNPGIYVALTEAAETMRRGGGVGYNFSNIRPRNSEVKGTNSEASGPCSYMNVFNESCKTVESAGCFAGETLIATTAGLVTVKEIVESDKEYYALTHLGPKKITAKFNNGLKPIWNVTTKYGYNVRVSKDHKFAQFENGKIVTKRIEDIYFSNNKNLLILIPNGQKVSPTWSNEEMTAYLVGAFQGNGTWINYIRENGEVVDVKGISISNNTTKEHIVDKIADFATKLGLNPKKSKRPNENTLEINIYDSVYFRNWKDLGVNKGMEMSVPSFILQGTDSERAAYVAGMMEADGYISETKSNTRLRLVTKELLKDIQVILSGFGVPATLKLERMAVENWKDLYCLGIYGPVAQTRFNDTVGNFMLTTLINLATRDRVGFSHPWSEIKKFGVRSHHIEKYWPGTEYSHSNVSLNALVNTVTVPELINTVTDRICTITIDEPETVYDLEVEDVHLLSGNGVYTSNSRRGAQMGILNIDHPDIKEFITAKRTPGRWNNFNVSVFVSNEFMEAKNLGTLWQLVHKAKPSNKLIEKGAFQRPDGMWVYDQINAADLWNTIMQSNYDFAEPGILFSGNINEDNNLRYCEKITATNPCAEQPLPPYGCCDLGPVILTKFVKNPFTSNAVFDYDAFKAALRIQVRFLDNVLDTTHWPLEQQRLESVSKRRIGVGFTGLANALAMLGVKYNAEDGWAVAKEISEVMRNTVYSASVSLAIEKGEFPLFNSKNYLEEGTFASRLPEAIKKKIRKHGIRNSHLLSIAPTGTVSLAFADNASNGIEPPYSLAYNRKKRNADETTTNYPVVDHSLRVFLATLEDKELANYILNTICDYGTKFTYLGKEHNVNDHLPKSLITAMELTVDEHLKMLEIVQPYIDTSISKTVNIPVEYPFEDFKSVYDKAFAMKLKGISTYRPNSVIGSVLSIEKPKEEIKTVTQDPIKQIDSFLSEIFIKRPTGRLPASSAKGVYYGPDGKTPFYVIVSFINRKIISDNTEYEIRRPIEVFFTVTPEDTSTEWISVFSRNMSLLARSNFGMFCKALNDCKKIKSDKGKIRYGTYKKENGDLIPRFHNSEVACMAYAIQEILMEENIIDENGKQLDSKKLILQKPVKEVNAATAAESKEISTPSGSDIKHGKTCPECGAAALHKRDGCTTCDNCGYVGSCG